MKKLIHFVILIILFSCKTDPKETSAKKEIILHKNTNKEKDSEFKYVIAESGLNYRKKPNGEIIGKFKYGRKVELIEHTHIFETIKDEHILKKGEWLGVKLDQDTVYIFSGYLSNKKISRNSNTSSKTNTNVGEMSIYENLPQLKFSKITKNEFEKIEPNPKNILPKINKNDTFFFIKTKNENFKFKVYKDYKENGSWSGSEYIGYYPKLKFYAIETNYTQDYLGFSELTLIDSISNNKYNIISPGDGAVEQPITSPKGNYLVYKYNVMYEFQGCFIGVIKVDELNKNNSKKYLTEFKSYTSEDWAVEEIKWKDNNTLYIKTYKEKHTDKKQRKIFDYLKTNLEMKN
ncbi:SH3 domain-containing protein [Cellulophaga sp. E16_2]|uniref:SH3 domain-containing protein n=1 Tax=Cellulophaga sp. E16_2 TaxID=2789297 RepID=UPI001A91ED46|nr:SH3 domain-containing protein [Cellulophaga sp. E16_2]MBO0592959.1 SH3 domain-containing protein [Cellulophaga sp. E16_2]